MSFVSVYLKFLAGSSKSEGICHWGTHKFVEVREDSSSLVAIFIRAFSPFLYIISTYPSDKSRPIFSQSDIKFLIIKMSHSDEILISASEVFFIFKTRC